MHNDRDHCGCKKYQLGDTITDVDENGNEKILHYVGEKILRDKDGNIMGVVTEWQ